jgi:hypothetical protein
MILTRTNRAPDRETEIVTSARLTAHKLSCPAKAHVPKSSGMAVAASTADAVTSDLQLP